MNEKPNTASWEGKPFPAELNNIPPQFGGSKGETSPAIIFLYLNPVPPQFDPPPSLLEEEPGEDEKIMP